MSFFGVGSAALTSCAGGQGANEKDPSNGKEARAREAGLGLIFRSREGSNVDALVLPEDYK